MTLAKMKLSPARTSLSFLPLIDSELVALPRLTSRIGKPFTLFYYAPQSVDSSLGECNTSIICDLRMSLPSGLPISTAFEMFSASYSWWFRLFPPMERPKVRILEVRRQARLKVVVPEPSQFINWRS